MTPDTTLVHVRQQFATALAHQDANRAEYAKGLADLDAYIASMIPDTIGPAVVPVAPGDNLADMLAQAAPYTIFAIAPDYTCAADFDFVKPVTLAHAGLATVPRLRTVGHAPRLIGHHLIHAPHVAFRGIAFEGVNRDRNCFEIYGADCLFDRSEVVGGASGSRRGIYLEAPNFYCKDSSIRNHWYAGREAQAIAMIKKAHHVVIDGCYLEGAGENILVGGDTIGAEADMCSDITITNSHLFKPLAWRTNGATVKNLFELKACVRVTMQQCLLENHWVDAQAGLAVVLTIRNQNGTDPFATIQDVLIDDCTLKNAPAGISILGRDDAQPSVRMARVTFRNFKMQGMSSTDWGGNGRTLQIMGGPQDLTFDGVTVETGTQPAVSMFASFSDPVHLCDGLVMRNMVVAEGDYGIHSSEYSLGTPTLDGYAPGYVWENNTVTRTVGANNIPYPPGTTIVPPPPSRRR